MRRPALLLLLLLLHTPGARALDWAAGAQVVGGNHSLTGSLPDEGNWEGKLSFGAGAMLDLVLTDDITLSLQPTWLPRNCSQIIEERGIVLAQNDFDLQYLSIPLLLRVSSDPGRVQGFVTAGFALGYLLEATATSDGVSEDFEEYLDDFTIGALFGAGALIGVGNQRLVLEFRYEQGIDDIVDRTQVDPTGIDSILSVKYRELKFSAGILFGPGGRR